MDWSGIWVVGPRAGDVLPLRFRREPIGISVVRLRIELRNEVLDLSKSHLFDWKVLALMRAWIAARAHYGLPLLLRQFRFLNFKQLGDLNHVGGLFLLAATGRKGKLFRWSFRRTSH